MLARDEHTPLERTPLHGLHVGLGGKMVPFAGYEMPVQYPSGIIAEHLHTRAKAGLFDVSHMGQIRLRGLAAAQALEALVPGDLQALAPGRMRYTLLLNGAILGMRRADINAHFDEIVAFSELEDFLENCLREQDDAPTIALKALRYFCDDPNPHAPVFKFAVLTVGIFLNHFHAGGKKLVPQQALSDLVALLTKGTAEDQIRRWIESHFGS